MKPLIIVLILSTAFVTSPALAQAMDMSNLTPALTYPETAPAPAPEPVSKAKSGISN